MIRYALECGEEHGFEAWFRSSDDFERQQSAALLSCPVCGSHAVTRALMAPAVSTSRKRAEIAATIAASIAAAPAAPEPAVAASAPAPPVPVTLPDPRPDPRALAVAEMLRQLRRHVEENAENVGPRFPEEARKIHYGETDARGIYGQASRDDVEALLDEGIEVHALPLMPEDRN